MNCKEELVELRISTGMNRREFCEYFEIPYRTVQDWEAGKRTMPPYLLHLMKYKVEMEKLAKKNKEIDPKKERVKMVSKIVVDHVEVAISDRTDAKDYICLTDIAKYKDEDNPRFIIQNWMRNRNTLEFLGTWEILYNEKFNRVEFEAFRTISGNPRLFNCRDESVKMCISAQQ